MVTETAPWRRRFILAWRIGAVVDRALMRRHGIGLSDFLTLCALLEAGESTLRVMELADVVGVSPSAMSRMLGRLEGDALVVRHADRGDRRASYAVLTETGARKVRSAADTFTKEVDAALALAADHA